MDVYEKNLYVYCIQIMAEETRTRYFYKLLKLHTKKVRYEHHCEFLADCKTRDMVPERLQLHKTANVDSFSDEFEYKWKNVLYGASKEMPDLVYQECQLVGKWEWKQSHSRFWLWRKALSRIVGSRLKMSQTTK